MDSAGLPADIELLGLPVGSTGDVPAEVGVAWDRLRSAGFTGGIGQSLLVSVPSGPPLVVYGVGDPAELDAAGMRDAAAAFARAAEKQSRLAIVLPAGDHSGADHGQAAVEGALLARYAYRGLRRAPEEVAVAELTLVAAPRSIAEVEAGARRGVAYVRAASLARDLANGPPSLLTAARIAEFAQALATECGLSVEVFDRDALVALGCGGLLGVNAGSVDPPRMIKIWYEPAAAGPDVARLTLVGKGIMYDSGGIALKPADAVHATMKNDMSGAGAILAAMAVLRDVGCPVAVTAYLMCTDNMPSGSATKLGDVLSIRGGTTVEVVNTDAEGRLVMADALVLATEEPVDAILDIATLTGACMRALGTQIAGVFGNDQELVGQVQAAADRVDEPVWQLPMAHRYRSEMDSHVADIKNMGGANGAAIHAALFLEEFVDGRPWVHIDIAGTAQNESSTGWQSAGCSGFGARLLVEFAVKFSRTGRGERA
ncbi:leucyl aminopeptidase [Amorphoplanes digitatis]|uniref:Probable cytosol aminopeptidase n=1 Tax=Actinoplanes digitatis TaxID=1868 RepID=A0A7W7MML7_9ACTN|nr:leucyl aminopeptidase [Actinoplanes digitatis]MBB4760118.1 leucyl aminopeptidase [Actinoplanes digitatis]